MPESEFLVRYTKKDVARLLALRSIEGKEQRANQRRAEAKSSAKGF